MGTLTSTMLAMYKLLILTVATIAIEAGQKWPGLRTTFGINPLGPSFFKPQPRTAAEAEEAGWHKVSSCGEEGKFVGNRYIEQFGHSLVLIFDSAGYIAGSQSMVRTLYVEDSLVNLTHPAYVLDYLGDWEAYFTPAYFVDPDIICNGGRSEDEFARDGTGDRLLIQVGDTPDMVVTIPQKEEEALNEADWFEHKCFPGMGKHVMGFNYDSSQDCDTVMPIQILYHEGALSGFVWQHYAQIPQDPNTDHWEYPVPLAVQGIVELPPDCLMEHATFPGLSTMHHYFLNSPWLAYC